MSHSNNIFKGHVLKREGTMCSNYDNHFRFNSQHNEETYMIIRKETLIYPPSRSTVLTEPADSIIYVHGMVQW